LWLLGQLEIELSNSDFQSVLNDIEKFAMEMRTSTRPRSESGEVHEICTDGPGYLTEYRQAGTSHWISGDYGEHANNHIAILMRRVLEENRGKFASRLGDRFDHPFDPPHR
jgi:hypothetical protein